MAEPAESASSGRVLIAQLRDAAPQRYAIIRRITLHYLDGRIQVEVELPLELALGPDAPEPIRQRFEQGARKDPDVSEVRVLFG